MILSTAPLCIFVYPCSHSHCDQRNLLFCIFWIHSLTVIVIEHYGGVSISTKIYGNKLCKDCWIAFIFINECLFGLKLCFILFCFVTHTMCVNLDGMLGQIRTRAKMTSGPTTGTTPPPWPGPVTPPRMRTPAPISMSSSPPPPGSSSTDNTS